ncbi:MAG TPA: energy transducer TonB [Candidatus Acidoferrum sp.]|nr:energy transducer TonB [Candidatus Acidoferrum sp.]
MATAVTNPGTLNLRGYLGYSALFHVVLTVLVLAVSFFERHGNSWGGVGGDLGGTNVSLVRSAGISLPRESMVTESKAVDSTKSLHKEEPPKPPEPKTDATKIPKFTKEKQLPPSPKSRTLESKTPEPDNAIPGHGGVPNLPTGYSQTPGSSQGVAALGQGGSDFGARYPWYVDAVRTRIERNWDQTTIDAPVRAAHTALTTITFRINPDGSISNIRLSKSSGNQSMDYSAQRDLLGIGSFSHLPNDYMGAYVDVTFDFDLGLAH